MTAQCPECGGLPGAHAITCPSLSRSTVVPPISGLPAQVPPPEVRRTAAEVIAKVLRVHRDVGGGSPDGIAIEVIDELRREGYIIT